MTRPVVPVDEQRVREIVAEMLVAIERERFERRQSDLTDCIDWALEKESWRGGEDA